MTKPWRDAATGEPLVIFQDGRAPLPPSRNPIASDAVIDRMIARDEFIGRVVREVAELPDRTSPDDYPDMMLVSADELSRIMTWALDDLLKRVK